MHVLGQIALIADVASDATLSNGLSLEIPLFLFQLGSWSSCNQRQSSENVIDLISDDLLRWLLPVGTTKKRSSCTRAHISCKNSVSFLLYPIDFTQMFIGVAVADPAQQGERILNKPMSPTVGSADKELHRMIHVFYVAFMLEQFLNHVLVKTHELEVQAHHLETHVIFIKKVLRASK